MKNKNTLWYIRERGHILGPFPKSVINNHIVIGRLSMQDEVSTDKSIWHRIIDIPELHPGPMSHEETEKRKRLLDERTGLERRQTTTASMEKGVDRSKERRAVESSEEIQRRKFHRVLMQKFRQRHPSLFGPLFVILSMLTLLALLAIFFPTILPVPLPNCSTPAGQGVNWDNCLKPNIILTNEDLSYSRLRNSQMKSANFMNATLNNVDLSYADLQLSNFSYADLQYALLIGVNLRQADLSYADLSHADLSYADLSGANLGGAVLNTTRFDHAIWYNGQRCAAPSVGHCVFVAAN